MMSSENHCRFCKTEASSSRELYLCPRCNVRYCSLSCYKHSDHSSCSELFYRRWVEEESRSDHSNINKEPNSSQENPAHTVFGKNSKARDYLENAFNMDKDDISKMDDKKIDQELQGLGITDPNDVEELLEELTDEEKEKFFSLIGNLNLDNVEIGK